MFKKLIEKLFGKRCACGTESMCDHAGTALRKEIKYCSVCKKILNEG